MIETNFLVQQYNFKRIDDHLLKVIRIFFFSLLFQIILKFTGIQNR